jgi:hypothetical protein
MHDQTAVLFCRCTGGEAPRFNLAQELANPKGLERSDIGRTKPAYNPGTEEQWNHLEKSITQSMMKAPSPPPSPAMSTPIITTIKENPIGIVKSKAYQ